MGFVSCFRSPFFFHCVDFRLALSAAGLVEPPMCAFTTMETPGLPHFLSLGGVKRRQAGEKEEGCV